MTTRYIFATLLFSFLSVFASAQTDTSSIPSIRKSFQDFNQLIKNGKFEESMDYIPKAVFEVVPRDEMANMFRQLMTSKEMEMKLLGTDIQEISEPKKIEGRYYAKIKYESGMTFKFIAEKVESPEDKKNRLTQMKAAFANMFGSDRVQLDEATEIFTINPLKISWAISEDGRSDWKFINAERNQRLILEKILPKELIEESLN